MDPKIKFRLMDDTFFDVTSPSQPTVVPGTTLVAHPLFDFGFGVINTGTEPFYYKSAIGEGCRPSTDIDDTVPKRFTPAAAWGAQIPFSDVRQYLLPGEMFPVLAPSSWEPGDEGREGVRKVLGPLIDFDKIDAHAKIARLIAIHEDHGSVAPAPTGVELDYTAVHLRRKLYFGVNNPVGPYETDNPFGTEGYDNFHYNRLLWFLLAYLRNPTSATFDRGMRFALAQAAWGFMHSGPKKGMFRFEKGAGYVGRASNPEWSKQFSIGMLGWYMLTGHPLFAKVVFDHVDVVENTPPNFWDGSWGERIPARYFDSAVIAYFLRPSVSLRSKIETAFQHVMTFVSPTAGFWIARAGYTSPWMQFKLLKSMARLQRLMHVGVNHNLEAVLSKLEATCVDLQTYGGYPRVAYRWLPATQKCDFSETHPTTHASLLIGAQEAIRGNSPFVDKVVHHIGSRWPHVVSGQPFLTPEQISYRVGDQGPGWFKTVPIALEGLLLK